MPSSGRYSVLGQQRRDSSSSSLECPELRASIFSRLSYGWVQPLLSRGYSKPLEDEDIWSLPPYLESDFLVQPLLHLDWNKSYPLLRAIIKSFVLPDWAIIAHRLLISFFMFVNPFVLRYLVSNINDISSSSSHLWFASLLLFIGSLGQSVLSQLYFWMSQICGMKARGAVMAAITRKSLRTANYSRGDFGTGAISNLMSVDADSFLAFFWDGLHELWAAPLQIIGLLVLLCVVIGPFGLLGVLVMVLLLPLNPYLMRLSGKDKEEALRYSDKRLRFLHEMIQGIRLLKLYSWESYFSNRINDVRSDQLNFVGSSFVKIIIGISLNAMIPSVSMMITFGAFTLSGHELSPEIMFTSIALFVNMTFPLNQLLNSYDVTTMFLLSSKRIEAFLQVEEVKHYHRENIVGPREDVVIKGGRFAWSSSSPEMQFEFRAPANKLTVIVGAVASGKSSLLASLLGEIDRVQGEVSMQENVAYVPQSAWLMTSSLRDNILFGKPFDSKRYRRVLHACALLRDLDLLPAGDLTEIGEKGINLSGGQKQRVSLARALYRDADCYLLDDCLSAVDAHVGKWLFEHVICGSMSDRTRILVTHQLQFIAGADHVVVMDNGRIVDSGTYLELQSRGINFEDIVNKKFGEQDDSQQKQPVIDSSLLSLPSLRISTDAGKADMGDFFDVDDDRQIGGGESGGQQGNIVQVEERQMGNIGWLIYKQYFSNTRSTAFLLGAALVFIVCQGFSLAANYWLSLWSTKQLGADRSNKFYLGVFAALIISFGALLFARS